MAPTSAHLAIMGSYLLLSILGGILAVDERAGWQSLVAQPVFAALFVGLIIGEVAVALAVGVVLELIWLSILPMRGLRRPDTVAGAVIGAGTAALLIHFTADPRVSFVVGVSTVMGIVVGQLVPFVLSPVDLFRQRYLERATDRGVRKGTTRTLALLHFGAVVYIFAVEAAVVLIALPASYAVAERVTRHVDGTIVDGATYWLGLLPAFGVAALVHLYWHYHLKRVLVATAVLVALVLWLQ